MSPQEEAAAPSQHSQEEQNHRQNDAENQDDDDLPMVHNIPKDYRSWALQERPKLEAEGKEVVLMSEVPSLIPRHPGESGRDWSKRYSETTNDMVRRGVMILNDECTADVAANVFMIQGREFDVGPQSGITRGEYRELGRWVGRGRRGDGKEEVPERFWKYEVKGGEVGE